MISLHSVLAGGLIGMIPTFFTVISVCCIAIAFITGFTKGFRKVSWDGLTWLTAGLLYLLCSKMIPSGVSEGAGFAISFAIALVCIVAALVGYGVLAHFMRPRVRWIKEQDGDTSLAEYGLEYEPEYLDYDGENDIMPYGKMIHKTGFNPPNFIGRLMGGICGAINVGMILWAIACAGLLMVEATMLKNLGFDVVLTGEFAQALLNSAQWYLLDFLAIGIIIVLAKKGYYTGFMTSLRALIVTFGGIGLVCLSFYLPFSAMANTDVGLSYFLNKLVVRCMTLFDGIGGQFSGILGRIFAGCVLALISGVCLFLLNLLLEKCCKMVSHTGPTRWIDACLACFFYMILGVAIVVGIWFLLSAFDYCNVLLFREIVDETAHLSNGLFRLTRHFVGKLVALVSPALGK